MNEIIATKRCGYYPSEEGDGITVDLYVPEEESAKRSMVWQ